MQVSRVFSRAVTAARTSPELSARTIRSLLLARAAQVPLDSNCLGLVVHAMQIIKCGEQEWFGIKPQIMSGLSEVTNATLATCVHCLVHTDGFCGMTESRHMQSEVQKRLDVLTAHEISAVFHACWRLPSLTPEFCAALIARTQSVVSLMTPQELLKTLFGAAKLGVADPTFYEAIAQRTDVRMGSFSFDEISKVLAAFSGSAVAERAQSVLLSFARRFVEQIETLPGEYAAMGFMTFTKAGIRDPAVLLPLAHRARACTHELSAAAQSMVATGIARARLVEAYPMIEHFVTRLATHTHRTRGGGDTSAARATLQQAAGENSPAIQHVTTTTNTHNAGSRAAHHASGLTPNTVAALLQSVAASGVHLSGSTVDRLLSFIDEDALHHRDVCELHRALLVCPVRTIVSDAMRGRLLRRTVGGSGDGRSSSSGPGEALLAQFSAVDAVVLFTALTQRGESAEEKEASLTIHRHLMKHRENIDIASVATPHLVNYIHSMARLRVTGLHDYVAFVNVLCGDRDQSTVGRYLSAREAVLLLSSLARIQVRRPSWLGHLTAAICAGCGNDEATDTSSTGMLQTNDAKATTEEHGVERPATVGLSATDADFRQDEREATSSLPRLREADAALALKAMGTLEWHDGRVQRALCAIIASASSVHAAPSSTMPLVEAANALHGMAALSFFPRATANRVLQSLQSQPALAFTSARVVDRLLLGLAQIGCYDEALWRLAIDAACKVHRKSHTDSASLALCLPFAHAAPPDAVATLKAHLSGPVERWFCDIASRMRAGGQRNTFLFAQCLVALRFHTESSSKKGHGHVADLAAECAALLPRCKTEDLARVAPSLPFAAVVACRSLSALVFLDAVQGRRSQEENAAVATLNAIVANVASLRGDSLAVVVAELAQALQRQMPEHCRPSCRRALDACATSLTQRSDRDARRLSFVGCAALCNALSRVPSPFSTQLHRLLLEELSCSLLALPFPCDSLEESGAMSRIGPLATLEGFLRVVAATTTLLSTAAETQRQAAVVDPTGLSTCREAVAKVAAAVKLRRASTTAMSHLDELCARATTAVGGIA